MWQIINDNSTSKPWQIIYDKSASKQLAKLALEAQATIKDGLQSQKWISLPRRAGAGSWMAIPALSPVRIADYRILCNISGLHKTVKILDIRYEPR